MRLLVVVCFGEGRGWAKRLSLSPVGKKGTKGDQRWPKDRSFVAVVDMDYGWLWIVLVLKAKTKGSVASKAAGRMLSGCTGCNHCRQYCTDRWGRSSLMASSRRHSSLVLLRPNNISNCANWQGQVSCLQFHGIVSWLHETRAFPRSSFRQSGQKMHKKISPIYIVGSQVKHPCHLRAVMATRDLLCRHHEHGTSEACGDSKTLTWSLKMVDVNVYVML